MSKVSTELKSILQKAGYHVTPYNIESLFASVKQEVERGDITGFAAIQKINSAPDCTVYDDGRHVKLLDIRCLNEHDTDSVYYPRTQLEGSLQHWRNATLVLMIPCGDYFYVKDIDKITESNINIWCRRLLDYYLLQFEFFV